MAIEIPVPGSAHLRLTRLLLDVNGTLSDRGRLNDGVAARVVDLRRHLDITLLTADTYGTLPDIIDALGGVTAHRVSTGDEKLAHLRRSGASESAAVGNGANDEAMLREAGLGIAVLGPEGAAPQTVRAADIVCGSISAALDLLTESAAIAATVRH